MKDQKSSSRQRRRIQVVCGVFHRTTAEGLEIAIFERKEPSIEFEFPGGKIEAHESEEQALIRELQEELSVMVSVGEFLDEVKFDYPTATIHLKAYFVQSLSYDFRLADHHRWTWVTARTWRQFKIAGPDIPLLEKIFGLVSK